VLVRNFWKINSFDSNFVGPYIIKKEVGFGKFLVSINDLLREVDKDDLKRWFGKVEKVISSKESVPLPNKRLIDTNSERSSFPKSSSHPTHSQVPSKSVQISSVASSPSKMGSILKSVSSPVRQVKNRPSDPLVGKRIEVWWDGEKKWYPGVIDKVSDNPEKGTHEILYDDERDKEDPNIYEFLKGKNKAEFRILDGD